MGQPVCSVPSPIGERQVHDEEVEFQDLEPLCRSLANPRYLPRYGRGSRVRQVDVLLAPQFHQPPGDDADDIRLPCRHREYALAVSAQQDRWMRTLDRGEMTSHAGDIVVDACGNHRLTREQACDDLQGLDHAIDTTTRRTKGESDLLILRLHPPGPQAQLEPSS